jgi:hypothetical protein
MASPIVVAVNNSTVRNIKRTIGVGVRINAAIVSKIDPESSGMEHKQHDRKQFRDHLHQVWTVEGRRCQRTGYLERNLDRYIKGSLPAPKLVRERVAEIAEKEYPARTCTLPLYRPVCRYRGLRIGFEAIGGQCVFTSEWDRWSNATYRQNFLTAKIM